MPTRRPFLKSFSAAVLALLALTGALSSAAARADIADVRPSAGFSYQTGHLTTIDIALTPSDGSPALVSVYSKGDNGLRLLHNAFTDADGRYTGELQVPAHLDRVVVVIRSASRQDQIDLLVYDQAIAYAE